MTEKYGWTMTSARQDGGIVFWIGQIRVAELKFMRDGSKRVTLHTLTQAHKAGPYTNMSEAMKEMHRLLGTPRQEGLTNAS
jgi:hypothetical protein